MPGRPVAVSLARMGQPQPQGGGVSLAALQAQLDEWDKELLSTSGTLADRQARADEILSLYSAVRNQVLGLEGQGKRATAAETAKLIAQGYAVGPDGLTSGGSDYHPAWNPGTNGLPGFTEYRLNDGATPIPRRVVNGRAYGDFGGASLAGMGRK